MNRSILLIISLLFLGCFTSRAQIVAWNPSGVSGFGPSPWSATTVAGNVTAGGLTRGPGVTTSGTAAGNAWGGTYWASRYASFTITANGGYEVSLSSFDLRYRRSGTGPSSGQLYYSLDGSTFTLITSFSYSSSSSGASLSTINLSGIADLQHVPCNTTIEFRILNLSGASTGTWYVYGSGLSVGGTVSAYPAPTVSTGPVPVSIAAGASTSFDASGISDAESFQWQRNTAGISGGAWVDISSSTMDPTGTYSGFASTGAATSSTLNLSAVPASWNGYGYRCVVTNCSGSTTTAPALLTVSSAPCSGTPTGGSAVPATAGFCASGSTTVSLAGGSTGTGLSYQWSSSPVNTAPGTPIAGATTSSYVTSTLTDTTFFWCTTTCGTSGFSGISTAGMVPINPLPVVSVPDADVCSGGSGTTMTASGASTYSWAPATGLSATTGATVTANPVIDMVYTITGTSSAGCSSSVSSSVTYHLTPGSLLVTPASASACAGDATIALSASGGLIGPSSVSSGTVTLPSSVGPLSTLSNSQTVAGVPAGAVISGVAVNIISFGSQYQDDYVINITAPNGNTLNLINARGTHTSSVTTLFGNTEISSAGMTSLGTGSGTFTGTWAADAVSSAGGAPYVSNVTDWTGLESVPNGNWTLSIYNASTYTNVVVPPAQWSLTLDYTYQAPVTWASASGLYTDASATVPYTGGAATSLYFSPATAAVTTYTATATNAVCTSAATTVVTVNPVPAGITGPGEVCEAASITLANTVAGGTWSCGSANASVGAATGIVTGSTAGTAMVTYTLSGGCYTTTIITVNAQPAAISGPAEVCEGATITLTDATTGGSWTSAGGASVDAASGMVTGVTAGTAAISYALSTGCAVGVTIMVDATPAAITGTMSVCEGASTSLLSSTTGGSWSAGGTSITIGSASGLVTGVIAGTSAVTYTTMPGSCVATAIVTVNTMPATISGPDVVCEGSSITLSCATPGGSWASSDTNASVAASTGIVTGVAAGSSAVTYTLPTSCATVKGITVNPLPASIAGILSACEGASTTLFDATAGGSWSSAGATVSVGSASGVVSAISAGTAVISYTLSTGCAATAVYTVNAQPASVFGVLSVCEGSNVTVGSSPSGGTWTSSGANATVGSTSGVVTGVSAGTSGITYTTPAGCYTTAVVTVNMVPGAVTGPSQLCEGGTTVFTNAATGGAWSSTTPAVLTVNNITGAASGLSVGTAIVSYVLPNSCYAIAPVTVNANPSPITGSTLVCQGATIALSDGTSGGSWSSSSGVATISSTTGVLTAVSPGTARIFYTLPTSCSVTVVVTVNPIPSAITGVTHVCAGFATNLYNTTGGGSWSSSATGIGTIDAVTGVVSGITAGTTIISYGLSTGCATAVVVTVNPLPPVIGGATTVCAGSQTTLTEVMAGGTWTTGNHFVANVDAVTGVVTGVAAGTTYISYTVGTGCFNIAEVTVNPLPGPVSGPSVVCAGAHVTLSSTTPAGVWVSSNTAVATVSLTGGFVTGVSAGSANITYMLGTGCHREKTVTVNAAPAAVTGSAGVCFGSATSLFSSMAGGTWSSTVPSVATVTSAGVVSALAVGTTIISYTLPATGCASYVVVTVQPVPAAYTVTGGGSYCSGGSGVSIGLSLSEPGVGYSLYNGSTITSYVTGTGGPIGFGLLTPAGIYTVAAAYISTGCARNMSGFAHVTVIPLDVPAVTIASSTGDSSCLGHAVVLSPIPVNGGAAPTYKWYVNNVLVSSAGSYAYIPADGDTVAVQMASNAVCRSVDTVASSRRLAVLPMLAPSVTMAVTPNDTVCEASTVNFSATGTAGGSAPAIFWKKNGGLTGAGATLADVPVDGDVYSCFMVSDYMCRVMDTAVSSPVHMTVLPMLTPLVSITAAPGLTINPGQSDTLTATVTDGGASPTYQWLVNGVPVTGATNNVFVSNNLHDGDSVTCSVVSSGLCGGWVSFNTVFINVVPVTGIGTVPALGAVRLVPNPNNGVFRVEGLNETGKRYTIQVVEVTGRVLHEQNVEAGGLVELGGNIANGTYLFVIRSAAGARVIPFTVVK